MSISRRKFVLSAALMIPTLRLFCDSFLTNAYFKHGVASGDPLQYRVIIWTRVSSPNDLDKRVHWEMAADKGFRDICQRGTFEISDKQDYTVKIDVQGLQPGRTYYYRFAYRGIFSSVGITQTLPLSLEHQNYTMAVVSCNNWEDGYFNSFRFLADRKEVDLVLHLGDYIYEYAAGEYGNPRSGRKNLPQHELVSLSDYRSRYAQYRTDPDLQQLHGNKPFYVIFDDHELANDAFQGGAQNHQQAEGEWSRRKQAAIQAYFEWMPIRAKVGADVRRKFAIGNDLSLFLMDERSYRTRQQNADEPGFEKEERVLLGTDQFNWLASELGESKATWKLIANQVMFSGYAVQPGFKLPKYNDWWLGYPFERNKLIDLLEAKNIQNPIFLTGDHHESFVFAVNNEKGFMQFKKPYDERPLAWEFLTPSITSKNADRKSAEQIRQFEQMLYDRHINPHMAFCDIKSHGYFIATISQKEFRTEYFFVDNILTKDAKEYKAAGFSIDAKTYMLSKDFPSA